jgi:proline iminopeptidase
MRLRRLVAPLLVTLVGCAHAPARDRAAKLTAGDHTVVVDGRIVAYHVAGHGPVCIAYPGGPGLQWSYLRSPELEKRLTVVYIEPPATGSSSPLPAGAVYNVQRYADELERFRAGVGLERACFLGHSHGGMVVQRYAIDHPEHVAALVIYGAMSRGDRDYFAAFVAGTQQFASRAWFAEAETALMKDDPKTDADATTSWAHQLPLYFADYDAHKAEYDRAARVSWSVAPLLAMMAPDGKPTDFRGEYAKVTAPTLVVAGKHDLCAPEPFEREIVDGIKGARLEWLANSGHMAHLEEPARFAEIVGSFVAAAAR